MSKGEKYCIMAGSINRPETIQRGVLEKNLGQGTIAGDVIETLNNRGDCAIPNWTECWGARLIDGKIPENPVSVNDTEYKGQIKELPWGHEKGYLIICRYLKGYNSIDQQYQDLVLNAKDNIREDTEASADAFYLRMQNGDNYYDVETDRYLVQMLRVHYLNKNSKHKSPEHQGYMFYERDAETFELVENKNLNNKRDALNIVNDASTDNSLVKLKNLYQILSGLLPENIKEEILYTELLKLADENPDDFMLAIQQFKSILSDVFEKAKSYNVLDLTKDGTIAAGKEKREVIATDIPGKKEAMLEWVFNNFLSEKGFEVGFQLKKITDKLK